MVVAAAGSSLLLRTRRHGDRHARRDVIQGEPEVTQEVEKKGIPPGVTGAFSATLSDSMLKWTRRVSHLMGAVTTAHSAHTLKGKPGAGPGGAVQPLQESDGDGQFEAVVVRSQGDQASIRTARSEAR
jgi:hypothetical protein